MHDNFRLAGLWTHDPTDVLDDAAPELDGEDKEDCVQGRTVEALTEKARRRDQQSAGERWLNKSRSVKAVLTTRRDFEHEETSAGTSVSASQLDEIADKGSFAPYAGRKLSVSSKVGQRNRPAGKKQGARPVWGY